MSSLVGHAKSEMRRYFAKADGEYERMVAEDVLALIKVFAEQGHSGMSASIVASLFHRLAAFKPLGPLTGEPGEWVEVGDGVLQNRRRSSVFKYADGTVRDVDAVVFEDQKGCRFTCRDSHNWKSVTFPYVVPDEPEIVKVDDDNKPLS